VNKAIAGGLQFHSSVNELGGGEARQVAAYSSVNKAVDWVRPPSRRSFNDE